MSTWLCDRIKTRTDVSNMWFKSWCRSLSQPSTNGLFWCVLWNNIYYYIIYSHAYILMSASTLKWALSVAEFYFEVVNIMLFSLSCACIQKNTYFGRFWRRQNFNPTRNSELITLIMFFVYLIQYDQPIPFLYQNGKRRWHAVKRVQQFNWINFGIK